MKLTLPVALVAAGLLAACADTAPRAQSASATAATAAAIPAAAVEGQPAASPRSTCLRTYDIVNHRIADDHTLYVRTRTYGTWRIVMTGACMGGAGPDDPLLIRETPGVPYACRPLDLDISIKRTMTVATPCIVNAMTRLTPAEIAALPDRVRP